MRQVIVVGYQTAYERNKGDRRASKKIGTANSAEELQSFMNVEHHIDDFPFKAYYTESGQSLNDFNEALLHFGTRL